MISLGVDIDTSDVDAFLQSVGDREIALIMEAVARETLNHFRRNVLDADAPAPPSQNPRYPQQLRRITGALADTAFIDASENGTVQTLNFPMEYAGFHEPTFETGLEDYEPTMQSMFERLLNERLRR